MPEELDDVEEPDDLIADDLADELDDDLIADDLADELPDDIDDVLDVELAVVPDELDEDADVVVLDAAAIPAAARPAPASEEAEEEEEEEPEDEDVEASLDVILKERLVVEDEEDDDEAVEVDDRSEISERVLPKQPDEFVCRSCFLVKHPSQLADAKKGLCRDCV